ncbi:hypothetical protein CEXT_669511 [Caerostris extrusa]|uniref:Uncharacterized protein n=1 Tax=Caerostris extrusa TaxID=172846 RepID=A0AAV4VUA4_CAEEX|nr:hypothetical protein CEXT_669511 [Caerostris extrusa]
MVERYVAACEEPVSRCPPSRRQRCPRDTTRKSAQKSLRADHPQTKPNRYGQPRDVKRDFPKSHLLKFGPFAGRVGVFQ